MGELATWKRRATLVVTAAVGIVAMLGVPAAHAANTYYTLPGAGNTSCALGDECSLTHALSLATTAGDEIVMEPGSTAYNPGVINIPAGITIGGQPGAAMPTIQGPGNGPAVTLNSQPGPTLHDVRINAGAGQDALFVGFGTVERVAAIAGSNPACELGTATLRNTLCASTSGDGILQDLGASAQTVQLENVTTIGSHGIEVLAGPHVYGVNGTNVITKGTVSDVRTANSGGPLPVVLTHSNYATTDNSMGGTITPPGTNGNQTAAPLFANAAGGDFHEVAGSPTIDAGFAAPDIGSLDLDRNARIAPVCLGGAPGTPDIGAYEYTAPPPCPVVPAPVAASAKKKCKRHHRHSAAVAKKKCKRKRKK